jgi:tetratricopeptide (TPR) repeat protein
MTDVLEPLVQLLRPTAASPADPDALGRALEALAHWRLACGDLQEACAWQATALAPGNSSTLRRQLRPLLQRHRPDLLASLQAEDDWLAVRRLLMRGHYGQAAALQNELLDFGAPANDTREPLLWAWLQAGQQQAALQLLRPPHGPALDPADIHGPDCLAAVGWLLHHSGASAEAIPWWQQALIREPSQPGIRELLQQVQES